MKYNWNFILPTPPPRIHGPLGPVSPWVTSVDMGVGKLVGTGTDPPEQVGLELKWPNPYPINHHNVPQIDLADYRRDLSAQILSSQKWLPNDVTFSNTQNYYCSPRCTAVELRQTQ